MSFIEVTTMTNYTSPQTGIVYDVTVEKHTRTDYWEFMNPATAYQKEYLQYTVYRDGKLVTFAFSESQVAEMVAWVENPGPDVGSRFD